MHYASYLYVYGPLVTSGICSKFSAGGGELVCHSSVAPPQGFDGAFLPFLKDRMKLKNISSIPVASIQDPMVEIRWPVWYFGR